MTKVSLDFPAFFHVGSGFVSFGSLDILVFVLIIEIKSRIRNLLLDVYKNKEYNYISEKRTYKADMTLESLEQLIKSDIYTGEGDRANLEELNKKDPDLNAFRKNHKVLRSANELRAVSKNELDVHFKKFIEDEDDKD